ncbi:hypothetical protein D6777_03345, partial [Candidatus Woesearchaeota archaeon]
MLSYLVEAKTVEGTTYKTTYDENLVEHFDYTDLTNQYETSNAFNFKSFKELQFVPRPDGSLELIYSKSSKVYRLGFIAGNIYASKKINDKKFEISVKANTKNQAMFYSTKGSVKGLKAPKLVMTLTMAKEENFQTKQIDYKPVLDVSTGKSGLFFNAKTRDVVFCDDCQLDYDTGTKTLDVKGKAYLTKRYTYINKIKPLRKRWGLNWVRYLKIDKSLYPILQDMNFIKFSKNLEKLVYDETNGEYLKPIF